MRTRTKCGLLGLISSSLLLFNAEGNAADVQERTIKLSYGTAADHPFGLGVKKFAEIVDQKSEGKITVRSYAEGQLGAEVPSISSAQGGVLEMAVTSTSAAVGNVKEFALFDFPFLFGSEKEADALLDGPVGTQLLDKLPEKGLIGLCYWESGFRNVTNSKHPVQKLEDMEGLKIRTIQNPVFLDTINALGANAVPMPFTELYTALETGAVDGQEGPYTTILTSNIDEVQEYLSATRHIYGAVVVLVGKKFWDQLSGDEKGILQDSCKEARDYERSVTREMSPKSLVELQARGMVFNEIAPEEMAKMRGNVQQRPRPIRAGPRGGWRRRQRRPAGHTMRGHRSRMAFWSGRSGREQCVLTGRNPRRCWLGQDGQDGQDTF
jgi:TRAP-type transport system periplasmic protein